MSQLLYIMVDAYIRGTVDEACEQMRHLAIRLGIDVRCKMNGYEYCAHPDPDAPIAKRKIQIRTK